MVFLDRKLVPDADRLEPALDRVQNSHADPSSATTSVGDDGRVDGARPLHRVEHQGARVADLDGLRVERAGAHSTAVLFADDFDRLCQDRVLFRVREEGEQLGFELGVVECGVGPLDRGGTSGAPRMPRIEAIRGD